MLKTFILAVIIFLSITFFNMDKESDRPPEIPDLPQQTTSAEDKEDEALAKGLFLAILPPREEWPEPVQKIYLAFNLEETIEPLRAKPQWVPLKEIPLDMQHALIAIEDRHFYEHGAISPESILRAMLVNITEGDVVQGGSTLTQQLVKNLFLTPEQNISRKVEEAILSLRLEEQYSKDEILEIYLNTTYFGAGADGIYEASRTYFGKYPQQLSLGEAAIIASLPYAPSALNPYENPLGCKKRQMLVLQAMESCGYLTQEESAEARQKRVYLTDGSRL